MIFLLLLRIYSLIYALKYLTTLGKKNNYSIRIALSIINLSAYFSKFSDNIKCLCIFGPGKNNQKDIFALYYDSQWIGK